MIEAAGSSPLARGLQLQREGLTEDARIIPARAGFTAHRGHGVPVHQDHPRSRGVYVTAARVAAVGVGSSPLARGLPYFTEAKARYARIIPARAGFTIDRIRSLSS